MAFDVVGVVAATEVMDDKLGDGVRVGMAAVMGDTVDTYKVT